MLRKNSLLMIALGAILVEVELAKFRREPSCWTKSLGGFQTGTSFRRFRHGPLP